MKKLFLMLFILLPISAFADQTFDQESGVLEEVYYNVPFEVTITEQNSPTDFYVSVGSGTTWEVVSSTYGWGDFNPATTVEITLDELYSDVNLGIHTGARNSVTFSVLPTDLSDETFDVNTGSVSFSRGPSAVWYDDIFYYEWDADLSTLPKELLLQYDNGSGWEDLEVIDITKTNGITIHNEFSFDDYSVRLTYVDLDYTLAEWSSTYNEYSFEIVNREEIEDKLWDDEDLVEIRYAKERLSEYTYVLAMVDGEVIDTIFYGEEFGTFITPSKVDTETTIEYYTEWGEYITDITIESEHKFFEVSPLTDEEYDVSETIPFTWSYSDHFELVTTAVLRNSNTMGSEVLNSDWELTRAYNYSVVEADSTLLFYFTVTDGHTTITRETRLVTVGGRCREAELEATIGELEREISDLRGTISILRAKVDSLEIFISEIEPDYVFVTLIKDVPNGVEEEYTRTYSTLPTLQIIDGKADMAVDNLTHVYIVDTIGRTYDAIWGGRYLYTDELQENAYFVVAIDAVGDVYTFKFVK